MHNSNMNSSALTGADDFFSHFELEPSDPEQTFSPTPPPMPDSFQINSDCLRDYMTGINNINTNYYGCTALMAVLDCTAHYYDPVEAGTIFLFPGSRNQNPPQPYSGCLYLNGQLTDPLLGTNPALHRKLCTLLSPEPYRLSFSQNFIGFSVRYPWNGSPKNIGYNSSTCNEYWFQGQRELPTDPVDWQAAVNQALADLLPAGDTFLLIPEQTWNNLLMALTIQADGSLSLYPAWLRSPMQFWTFIPVPNSSSLYYVVNPFQATAGNYQLFGTDKGNPLQTKPFSSNDPKGMWLKGNVISSPYQYIVNNYYTNLVIDSFKAHTDPGTMVQLWDQNAGPGQIWWLSPAY